MVNASYGSLADDELYSKEDFLKQCPTYDWLPTILPPCKRIVVIGDIHGDIDLAIKSFKIAKLIDNNMNWIANPPNTIVVQVGDQIDSCRPVSGKSCKDMVLEGDFVSDLDVINFFDKMNTLAKKYNGAVYNLLGNHEIMNIDGDFRYVSRKNYYDFEYTDKQNVKYTGPEGRYNAFKRSGPLSTHLACSRSSVIIVGSTMFAHAGVLPLLIEKMDYLHLDNSTKLKYINGIVRSWILGNLSKKFLSTKDEIIDNESTSVFWNRIYGKIPLGAKLSDPECYDNVGKILQTFKIGNLVVGHTPQSSKFGINGTCKNNDTNTLYRVDGGFSKAFDMLKNNVYGVQVLEILDDKIFNVISG